MEPKDVVAGLSLLVASTAFLAGLIQYRKAQAWKKAEFVAAEVKALFADPAVQFALHLLDWNLSCHDLRSRDDDDAMKEVWIGDATLVTALSPHSFRSAGFSPVEVRVRLAFDVLLDGLQRFEHFIETDLVKEKDFLPYLRYWLDLMGSSSSYGKSAPVLHAIWRYIAFYRYGDVQRFFLRYGFDISKFPEAPEIVVQPDGRVITIPTILESGNTVTHTGFGDLAKKRSAGG